MPRVCHTAGISPNDPCPKIKLLEELQKALDKVDNLRTPKLVPRLHITSEVCKCNENKNKNKGKLFSERKLQTVTGEEAFPQVLERKVVPDWYPPKIKLNRDINPYMPCFNAKEPAGLQYCPSCDCRFGMHLASTKQPENINECCYIECEHDKPGFRNWSPNYKCNYPNFCKANCFEHPNTNYFFDLYPSYT